MSSIAALSRADNGGRDGKVPWDLDPTLLPLLRTIVSAAAACGAGACLAVATAGGEPHVLARAHGPSYPWRALASAALEQGELIANGAAVAVPVRGPHGLRGALLLHYGPDGIPANADHVARAHAARLEMALAASVATLATTQGVVDALIQALTAHDAETARHGDLVRRLAVALGTAAKLTARALLELEWAALLHDVGKIGISPRLLQKAGPLSATEWALVRQHPAIGERIVRAVPGLDDVGVLIRHHHEQWDGSGYPDRLIGAAIPLGARFIALADAYEAMRTGRVYQPARGRDEVLGELRQSAGAQFDPTLISMLPVLADHDIDL